MVDTLRADHLGCYGHTRETSPAIDALAREGTRFERAYATAPWTMPSVASILTGLYPSEHGATNVLVPLPDSVVTLGEVLKANGFGTSAVVSHKLISAENLNFGQGFDVYSEDEARGHGHVSSEGVTRAAIQRLRHHAERAERFLLFVHYFDPHFDYQDHPEIDFAAARQGRLSGGESYMKLRALFPHLEEEEVQFIRDLYDEEIRHTDNAIAKLLAEVSELGLDDRTIVVLTADHGEEFGEHGSIGHTRELYEEVVHVPLIIRAPGGVRGHIVSTPVSLVSVMPTILELAGVSRDLDSGGGSLAPFVRERKEPAERKVFVEVDFISPFAGNKSIHKKSMIRGDLRLIQNDKLETIELYDRSTDPHERLNLTNARPALTRELVGELRAHLDRETGGKHHSLQRDIDAEEIDMLKALGYLK